MAKEKKVPIVKRLVKGEWSAMGHQFGEDLVCRCEVSFQQHQLDPQFCPNLEKIHANERCHYERDHKVEAERADTMHQDMSK